MSINNSDYSSSRPRSSLVSSAQRQDLLADLIGDGLSERSDSDSDDGGSDRLLESIPERFRPQPPSDNSQRRKSTAPCDVAATLAGRLFWKGNQVGRSVSCVVENTSTPTTGCPVSPPLSKAKRQPSQMVRQLAFCVDSDEFQHSSFQRSSTFPRRTERMPERPWQQNRAAAGDSLDPLDDVASASDSDEVDGSVSDQSSADGGPDEVDAFKDQLQTILQLMRGGIPMHFWPRLKSDAECRL